MFRKTASLGARVLSIRFAANGSDFVVEKLESLQVLHYATVATDPWDSSLGCEIASGHFLHERVANITATRKAAATDPLAAKMKERFTVQGIFTLRGSNYLLLDLRR